MRFHNFNAYRYFFSHEVHKGKQKYAYRSCEATQYSILRERNFASSMISFYFNMNNDHLQDLYDIFLHRPNNQKEVLRVDIKWRRTLRVINSYLWFIENINTHELIQIHKHTKLIYMYIWSHWLSCKSHLFRLFW